MQTTTGDLASLGLSIPVSQTRALANAVMGKEDVLALWFGEPDVSTPDFICEAAEASMKTGATFYTEGLGKPFLRTAIAQYMSALYGTQISDERIAITASGTNAVNLAFQLLMLSGEKIVTTSPAFPTLLNVPRLQYAALETVPLTAGEKGWALDMDRLLDAAKDAKILLINSPNNPTGWTMTKEEIVQITEACRTTGTWIISDEVYARIVYDGKAAPSFAEVATPEDRILIVNSFSKTWAMTGWRLGWLTLPTALSKECEKLMEFSMSCAPEFVQAAGKTAIEDGEAFIEKQIEKYKRGKAISIERLSRMDRVRCSPPGAAFYVHFQIDGVTDNIAFAKEMALTGGVGLAPGTTFDPEMQDWFRLCFAKDEAFLHRAFDRLEAFLAAQKSAA